jgi:hypothetical protein
MFVVGPRCTCLGGGRGGRTYNSVRSPTFPSLGRLSDIAAIAAERPDSALPARPAAHADHGVTVIAAPPGFLVGPADPRDALARAAIRGARRSSRASAQSSSRRAWRSCVSSSSGMCRALLLREQLLAFYELYCRLTERSFHALHMISVQQRASSWERPIGCERLRIVCRVSDRRVGNRLTDWEPSPMSSVANPRHLDESGPARESSPDEPR